MQRKSMMTFRDNLPRYRRQYTAMSTKRAQTRFLDALSVTYPFERKYLMKLLRGKRVYRAHHGRRSSYSENAKELLVKCWQAAGYPCAEYLKPILPKIATDYRSLGYAVEEGALSEVLRMSPSTIGRTLRGRLRPAGHAERHRNKRSGFHALKKSIPEMPGSELPEDTLGTCQVDSVTLSGGNAAGSFFSIATLTDALTQWFECAPAWNHGADATTRAMCTIADRLPFDVRHLHPDNGGEFINHLFVQAMRTRIPAGQLSRSRPYCKNDNCRIEQKNGSVIRDYFGDIRFDEASQLAPLEQVCHDIALYTNLFRPCKKLVSKTRKVGKGVKYHKRYDAPQTPLDRLAKHLSPDAPALCSYMRLREQTNSITLFRNIQAQLRKLVAELARPRSLVAPTSNRGAHSRDEEKGRAFPAPANYPPDEIRSNSCPSLVSTYLTDATPQKFPFWCPCYLT
jgi:hypothetical protein